MPKHYWMVVLTPENYQISKEMGFTLLGLRPRYRRRVERMEPDDLVLFYVSGTRKWAATATVKSRCYEDRTPVWKSLPQDDGFPFRVKINPSIMLDEEDHIDAMVLGPSLTYVKRWLPEMWPLAFFDSLHILPQRDFRLIEAEMKEILSRRRKRRRGGRSRRDRGRKVPSGHSAGKGHEQAPQSPLEPALDPAPVDGAGADPDLEGGDIHI